MAFNGSGTFNRVFNWVTDKGNSVPVTASRMDSEDDGFATGLTAVICKDGQTVTTARIPFVLGTSALQGTVSGVSYSFTSDLDTGIYSPATDQVAIAAGGVQVLATTATTLTIPIALAVTGASGFTGEIIASATATFITIAKFTSTSHFLLPSGTTGQRPSNAAALFRYNSTLSAPEFNTGSAWKTLRNEAPTAQVLTSGTAATYTTPSGATWLKIRVMGGGGGGGGGGTAGTPGGDAGIGGTSSFNSVTAVGGSAASGGGGSGVGVGGLGGTGGTGTVAIRIPGGAGSIGFVINSVAQGGAGGSSPFGSAGVCRGAAATAAGANSGSGGGGGPSQSASSFGGGGGGAGEYYELIILAPSATYTYTVGAAGTAGAAGNGAAGGAGAAGVIIVEEYYS